MSLPSPPVSDRAESNKPSIPWEPDDTHRLGSRRILNTYNQRLPGGHRATGVEIGPASCGSGVKHASDSHTMLRVPRILSLCNASIPEPLYPNCLRNTQNPGTFFGG